MKTFAIWCSYLMLLQTYPSYALSCLSSKIVFNPVISRQQSEEAKIGVRLALLFRSDSRWQWKFYRFLQPLLLLNQITWLESTLSVAPPVQLQYPWQWGKRRRESHPFSRIDKRCSYSKDLNSALTTMRVTLYILTAQIQEHHWLTAICTLRRGWVWEKTKSGQDTTTDWRKGLWRDYPS